MALVDKECKVAIMDIFKDIKENMNTQGTNGGSVKKWKYNKELNGNLSTAKHNITRNTWKNRSLPEKKFKENQ